MRISSLRSVMIMMTALILFVFVSLIPANLNHNYAMAQQCDQSLWHHIYQPKRLTVIDICKTVSGTIVDRMRMADGDFHIRVKLDPQFENILKPANYAQQDGYLVVEPVCQTPPRASEAAPFCENFHQNINIPAAGTHVSITGSYVLDEEHNKWAEIHPVTSIVKFGSSSSDPPPPPPSSSSNSCPPCVIFRIDDISDSHASSSNAVMKLFLAENEPLTLGIVMNHIGKNPSLIENILEGKNKSLFELALHGYDHINYTKLPPQEQLNQLSDANQRMQDLFGKPSDVFIPPYDFFNKYTIDAMTKLGIRIISAGDWDYGAEFGNSQYKIFYANGFSSDKDKDNSNNNNNNSSNDNGTNDNQIIHIPRDIGFESFDAPQPILVPIGKILNETNSHLQIFGYSVIVMHPESFLVMKNGKYTKTVDERQINNLKTLIDSIKSKNIHITSFSKLASPVLNS